MASLTIGGVAYDAWLSRATLSHVNDALPSADTLDFTLIAVSGAGTACPQPAVGAEVIYTFPGSATRLFGGILTSPPQQFVAPGFVGYTCSCSDYRVRANRHIMNDRYINQTPGQIIVAAFATYAPEFDTSQVDLGGTVIASIRFKRDTRLTAMLDRLGQLTGYHWDINPSKQVTWKAPGTVLAPFGLADGSLNFFGLQVAPNRDQLKNRVIVKGGLYPNPTTTTDQFSGDGVTGNFRPTKTPYGTDQYVVFDDEFKSLNLATWVKSDVNNPTPPAGHISSDGYLFTTLLQGAQLTESGWLQVVGGDGTWGDSRLQGYKPIGRGDGFRRFELDAWSNDITGQGMCGLWDPNNLAALAGAQHAVYFNAGTIVPYENGAAQTALAAVTYTAGSYTRIRIFPKAAGGAVYWVQTGANYGTRNWTKLYDSSFGTLPNLAFTPIFNRNFNGRVTRARVYNRLFGASLTVGGVSKVLGLSNIDADSGCDAVLSVGSNGSSPPLLSFYSDTLPPVGTNNVQFVYQEGIPVLTQAQDNVSIAALAALEGNDGIYDGYIEDPTLDSLALARARGAQEIQQFSNPVINLKFGTRTAGLRAGQLLPVNLSAASSGRSVVGQFLITKVTCHSLGSGVFEFQVEAGSTLKGIDDYLYDLILRGKRILEPDDQNEAIDLLAYNSDLMTMSDTGTVTGPQVTTKDTITFNEVWTIGAGPLPPYVYDTPKYGFASYA